ncbi:hypothetical protein [Sandaracinus amylolyticus]|uniref:Uncharacterized protein n=1 Tax=Sandaracinus amylolyticus TaxID=927083 RepID=A0A0F6SI83_9BACT|nr:hypothetical protein [Sandaracinus amylolyticus]AKF11744.1 hypothetical protein DB32_008893 [Sandaracinus amylolyticus]
MSVPSADVPQAATKLGRIRATIEVLARAPSTGDDVATHAGMARRHAHYQLAAARALGWATREGARRHAITREGRALLATTPGSAAEVRRFVRAVRASPLVQALSQGIDPRAPDLEFAIADRIERLTAPPLAKETARERARTIAAWVRLAASPQEALAFAAGVAAEDTT